jgi:serine phosphatase RsbU (regulator of sigma subunit)
VIDMAAIRRDIVSKMMPEGSTANMTPEARQQLYRELSMRLMGITEGLKLGAAELQKKADEARQKADEDAKKAEAKQVAEGAPGTTQTKSALKGNQLGVTVSRNGQIVHTVNAEINLDNVLMTVFSTTRRDRGEVPFAVAKDGKIYTAVATDQAVVQQFGPAIKPNTPVGETTLPDWIIVTTNDPSGSGLRFGIARPVGDSLNDLRKRAGRNAGLGLVLIAIALVGVVPVSSRLTRNLSTLTGGVERIAQGDYTARVQVKSGDEIGVLAAAFNQMAADVEAHQRSLIGQERLKRELELGRQIQNEMLPHEPLRLGLTEVKGVSVPAREVGGDFFNYFPLPTGEVALLVGDVSGKGVGAALVMANIQATLRTRLALEQDLPVITDAIDRDMEAGSRAAYATLFVGIFNPITMRLRYVNAGHHPQFVLRADGTLERMPSTGTPIGLLSGRGYTQGVMQVATGDFVFFYTDGLVEAENEFGEFFGSERLEAVLHDAHQANGGAGIDDVLRRVERAVADFRGAREPFDDVTMMAVKI